MPCLVSRSENRVLDLFQILRETNIATYFLVDRAVTFDVPRDEEILQDLMLGKRYLSATLPACQEGRFGLAGRREKAPGKSFVPEEENFLGDRIPVLFGTRNTRTHTSSSGAWLR